MRKSVIDIGTNTILMLIADYDEKYFLVKTIADIQRVPRLGKGVDKGRNILHESTQKAVDILNEYKKISSEYNSTGITATATSFIRDSANKTEFINTVKDKTGIEIKILSGNDEAKWTFIGGVYDKAHGDSKITTIDIGGGSTEITIGAVSVDFLRDLNSLSTTGRSLDVGSVRVNEKFLSAHPPSFENIVQAERFIDEHLDKIDFDLSGSDLIGVAGTVTTLAAIKLRLTKFEAGKVDNTVITLHEIQNILNSIAPLTLEELTMMGDYMQGRADIVVPGILILKCFMRKFDFENVTVSTKGLRYGIFLREAVTK